MPKFLTIPEIIPFKEDSLTERGERVYTHLKIELIRPWGKPFEKVIQAENGIGFTEEWIEDTTKGCLTQLEKDFPTDFYKVVYVKPNHVRFEYVGPRGMVQ